jgi:predicted RNase H-like nuclease
MNESRRYVAGVDGCKGGWVVVLLELNGERSIVGETCRVVDSFQRIIAMPEHPRFVGVDIPIGLPTVAVPGGRACDREARQLLGKRRSSVFSPPVRAVLSADSYEKAVALSRASSRHAIGITRQVYGLVPKLREVHDAMTPDLQVRIREIHPELSFTIMNDGEPLRSAKSSDKGRAERLALLERNFGGVDQALGSVRAAARGDLIDAYAAAWSAWRMARGKARYIPDELQMDSRGLRMGIWF